MCMIQAKELTQYKEDKTSAKLQQSFQIYYKQTYTVYDTLANVLAVY